MTIQDNFKTGITGAELLKVGIQCAEDAGFRWPKDWQYRFTENEPFVTEGQNSMSLDATYRINPERLKPKAPAVGLLMEFTGEDDQGKAGWLHTNKPAVELTDQVRRRLSEDAGVDWRKVSEICMKIQLGKLEAPDAPEKIMQLIAAAAVEVKK